METLYNVRTCPYLSFQLFIIEKGKKEEEEVSPSLLLA
jgi:hypothetical protein